MPTYYLTFASKTPFRNGWVEIEAEHEMQVIDLIEETFGCSIDSLRYNGFIGKIYPEEQFNKSMFPLGKIGDTIK